MPRHATSLGAGNFPSASKLLQRYEQEKAYKMHQQKMANMRHRLDTDSPKKYNHLLLRLKQVQKDEERQAQIDYENKLLLTKMTSIMKYGGSLDNYNNYEIRSLNYPHRNKVNDEILRENIGIAKRLETVKPQLRIDKWEKDYHQHAYLKRLWSDSIKDFGDFTPRRISRLSKAVKRSMDDSLDEGYTEEYESEAASDDRKKLPKLGGKHKAHLRATKSETEGPVSRRGGAQVSTTKLPKIVPHKHRIKKIRKSYEENKAEETVSKSSTDKDLKSQREKSSDKSPYSPRPKEKGTKKERNETSNKTDKKSDNVKQKEKENNKSRLETKNNKMETKSLTSIQSVNVAGNDLERVKTLISEENERESDEEKDDSDTAHYSKSDGKVNENSENQNPEVHQSDNREETKKQDSSNQKIESNDTDEFYDETSTDERQSVNKNARSASEESSNSDVKSADGHISKHGAESSSSGTNTLVEDNSAETLKDGSETENELQKTVEENDLRKENNSKSVSDNEANETDKETNVDNVDITETQQENATDATDENEVAAGDEIITEKAEDSKKHSTDSSVKSKKAKQKVKGSQKKHIKEDGTAGATGKEETTDVAQLFKIAKQLGRPEDIFIKTLIKKTHKQRMATKAKFRQKYDLDLISELKTGLGLQWELLIKEMLEDRGFADALAVFDAMCDEVQVLNAKLLKQLTGPDGDRVLWLDIADMSYHFPVIPLQTLEELEGKKTVDVSDVVEVLCTRNNAAMAELKESYRKEFSLTLEEDIMDRTRESVQTLLLALQKGERDETPEPDLTQCHDDAVALYESGEGRWTSENGLFMKLIRERSPQHMQCVLNEFKTVSEGQEILDIMKEECPKDFFLSAKTYVNCTRSPATYFAEKLHANKLPSNPVFVATLAARSEIDAPAIRKAYKKKYHIDLVEDIKNSSYPTTKCLMELAAKVPPVKKDNQPKKSYSRPQQPPQVQPQSQTKKVAQPVKTAGALTTHKEPQQQKTKEPVKKTGTQQPQQAQKSKQDTSDNQAAVAKPKETVKNNGTVKPASNFNAEDDCDKLNRAMSYDDGADETVVVAIIPKRSNKQRQEIKKVYEQKYKKNLMIDLESELQGDMEEIVFALLMTPTEYDAYVVHKAVEEMGTSEATLIGILCTRSSKELKAIKDYYKQAYKSDMEKDISGDCRGDFGDLVMALCKTDRQPGSEVNKEEAQNDAKAIFMDGSLDLKGETFKTLLTQKNHAQVAATFVEFEKLAGHDIYTAMSQVMQDDDEGYIGVAKAVGEPVLFYTEAINSCFAGSATNDNMLIRCVVPRSEIDLLDIKAKYVELQGKGLWDVVNREVTGSYKNLLLAIINNDSKKKTKQTTNKKPKNNKQPAGPTVKPTNPFDPDTDCKRLYESMDGFGTNEDVIIDIIPRRCNKQRQDLKIYYQDKYGKRLADDLESELNGDVEEIILALMMTPTEYDAYCLHDAIEGLGTTESVLIGIICTRSAQELETIKDRYKQEYDKELVTDITEDTSGGLEDMLVGILECNRDQGTTVDIQEAREDAEKLYKDGQISIDPEDNTFKEILVKKNKAQVKATFEEYKKLFGNDIYYGIDKAFFGDTAVAYRGLAHAVEDPVQFYAERLFASLKGARTNDKMLIRIVVSRSEIDLEDIKVRYHSLYKHTLAQSVQDECSGDYKKILLAIIGDTPAEKIEENDCMLTVNENTSDKTEAKADNKVSDEKQKSLPKKAKSKNNRVLTKKKKKKGKQNRKLNIKLPNVSQVEDNDKSRPNSQVSSDAIDDDEHETIHSDVLNNADIDNLGENKEQEVSEDKTEGRTGKISRIIVSLIQEEGDSNESYTQEQQKTDDQTKTAIEDNRNSGTDIYKMDDNEVENKDNDDLDATTTDGSSYTKENKKTAEQNKQHANSNMNERKESNTSEGNKVESDSKPDKDKRASEQSYVILSRTSRNYNIDKSKSGDYNKKQHSEPVNPKRERPKTADVGTQCGRSQKHDGEDNDSDEDCIKFHEALYGKNTENETVSNLLASRSMDERLGMARAYKTRYGRDILQDVKSSFKGDFRDLCFALLQDQTTQDAELLHYSVKGLGTNEAALIHILATRSPQEISKIKDRYLQLYSHLIDVDVQGDTSGSFQTLCLVQLSKANDDSTPSDEHQAEDDARRMWRPGERPTQDNEDVLIEVLTSFNREQFASVCHIYQKITGVTFKDAVTKATKGDFRDALLAIASFLEDSYNYHAETLHKSLKGFRSNDRLVINILLSQEAELGDINKTFEEKYGKTLHHAIKSNYSGDFAKLILQFVEHHAASDSVCGDG